MRRGEQFRGDYEQLIDFGMERFHALFSRRLLKSFWEFEHGNKRALRFVQVSLSDGPLAQYHYPPRYFVRGSVAEACADKTIE